MTSEIDAKTKALRCYVDPQRKLCSHVRQNVGFSVIRLRSGERGYPEISAGLLSRVCIGSERRTEPPWSALALLAPLPIWTEG
jgi:hypothetical protein